MSTPPDRRPPSVILRAPEKFSGEARGPAVAASAIGRMIVWLSRRISRSQRSSHRQQFHDSRIEGAMSSSVAITSAADHCSPAELSRPARIIGGLTQSLAHSTSCHSIWSLVRVYPIRREAQADLPGPDMNQLATAEGCGAAVVFAPSRCRALRVGLVPGDVATTPTNSARFRFQGCLVSWTPTILCGSIGRWQF
jgi:hypothetical protein